MEIYELQYFLAAAELESIHKAAVRLRVSSPAVSRAVARLEEELGVLLFERVGRNIALSNHGRKLQREASRVTELKSKFKPAGFAYSISIAGTEFGLSAFLSKTIQKLKASKVPFSIEVKIGSSSKEVERIIADGEAQLGIIGRVPSSQFQVKQIGHLKSRVYVGEGHSVYAAAKSQKEIGIETVLQHEFAGFLEPFVFELGAANVSADGWRDDKFPRKIGLRAESIESALRAVEAGLYISYLPEAIAENRKLFPIKVTGCPYKCETDVFLLATRKTEFGWMNALF
jgi:DNA-binding transcriptional LysR family regulator